MQTFLTILIGLAMFGTLAMLGLGVIQMARGGDPHRANKLMQNRVLLQGIALALFALLLFSIRS
jgi:hypothetical protein